MALFLQKFYFLDKFLDFYGVHLCILYKTKVDLDKSVFFDLLFAFFVVSLQKI
jgi:hypothetical protein